MSSRIRAIAAWSLMGTYLLAVAAFLLVLLSFLALGLLTLSSDEEFLGAARPIGDRIVAPQKEHHPTPPWRRISPCSTPSS